MRFYEGVWKAGVVVTLAGGLAGVAGCNKLRARDLLNKGVQAYKVAQFDQAEEDFKQAAALDPTLANARIYLATAYASQFVPGSPSPANLQYGQEAIAQFKRVLDSDPNNLSAIDGIGSMLYNLGTMPYSEATLQQAKQYHEKHIQLQPEAAQPYYWVAVIDWTIAFNANRALREQYNTHLKRREKPITFNDPLPPDLRDQFAAKYSQTVDEGIQQAQKAIQLHPNYADAMSYLNLLDRQKADMVASADERADLLKQADELVKEVNEIKQKESTAPKSASAS
jgi:tetratricopeptide (TPR) repeat protein